MSGPGGVAVRRDPFLGGIAASAELWQRLERPFEQALAYQALLGVPPDALANLARLLVAAGPETESLLDGMGAMLRVLRNTTGKRPETRRGEVRGGVIWSETLSARASSFGADDLFVCAAPFRDFDIAENRVLVHVLHEVVRAADDVNRMPVNLRDGELGRRALRNRDRAHRLLGQRGLRDVKRSRPTTRELAATRRSRDAVTYRPALAVHDRLVDPVRFDDLVPFVDRRTRIQHALVLSLADEIGRRGVELPAFTVADGAVRAGPLAYRHQGGAGGGLHGILLGRLLVDVPLRVRERDPIVARAALERRAGGRPSAVVLHARDIPAIVDAALRDVVGPARPRA